MTSESQLGQEAVDLAQQTSWPWDKFLNEIRTNPDYQYKNTPWYRAGGKLEESKHLSGGGGSPIPPP